MTWREEERKKSSVNWWWEEERKIERENWCGGKKGGSWQTERRIFKWLHNNDCGGFSLGVWESKLVSFRGKQFLKHADFFLQYEANTLCTGHWHWIHYLDLVLYVLPVHCGIATGIYSSRMLSWSCDRLFSLLCCEGDPSGTSSSLDNFKLFSLVGDIIQ